MSMSDLELLQLVETVKEKQRGPAGPAGVGIERIEQFDATGFTLRLTDGSFKRIDLPTPKDGSVGPVGPAGPVGESGSTGRPGRDGVQGPAGRDGTDGLPGSFVETAVVNSDGHLLLGISDGAIIDVGRVVGPAGATGPVGATGLAGESGKDGAAVLSGPRAPQADDGVEGDHWIDISSAEFSFFKKDGEGWTKLANLRQPARDPRVGPVAGGGGAGGGGKGEPQNTRTLPLINGGSSIRKKAQARGLPPVPGELKSQEDANLYFLECIQNGDVIVSDTVPRPPYQQGQLWFSTNPDELTLYIYDGAVWVPAAPPVSLEGIENSIASVDAELMKVNANIAMNKRDIDEAILDVREDQERQDEKITEVEDDQQRQDEKIAELEGEVDDLKPTIERGEWAYNAAPENANSPAPGEYHAYVIVSDDYCKQKLGECLLNAGGDLEEGSKCNRENEKCLEKVDTIDTDVPWHDVTWLVVHRNDIEGRQHSFGDVVPGLYIEVINADGTGHGLYIIEAKSLTGVKCGFNVKLVHSTGHPNGKAVIKIFKMAEAANPADFVKKDGDEMTGALKVTGYSEDNNPLLKVAPTSTKGSNSDIFKVYSADGNSKFWITNEGDVSVRSEWFPKYDRHLTTKKYVDTNFVNKAGATMTGRLNVEVGKSTALYLKSGLTNTSSIFYVRNATDKTQFRVTGTGQVQAGDSSDTAFMAAQGNDVVTKKYLDETLAAVGVSPYGVPYKYVDPSTRAQDLKPGEFFISNSSDPKHCIYASQYAMSDNQNPLISDRYAARGVNICLKVYDSNGTMKHQVQCSDIGTGNGSNNYVKWTKSYNFTEPDDLKVGEIYYLSDGFLLPY